MEQSNSPPHQTERSSTYKPHPPGTDTEQEGCPTLVKPRPPPATDTTPIHSPIPMPWSQTQHGHADISLRSVPLPRATDDDFRECMHNILNLGSARTVIMGDLNAWSPKWSGRKKHNRIGRLLERWANIHNFTIHAPQTSTLTATNKASIVDLILSRNCMGTATKTRAGTWTDQSDHHLVTTHITPLQTRGTGWKVALTRLRDTGTRQQAQGYYKDRLPIAIENLKAATTPALLEQAVEDLTQITLNPFLIRSKAAPWAVPCRVDDGTRQTKQG
ncbi:hypothetical protein BWQ96_10910 [Gracilariopsis chorda]|uniref:Endonuclease/exonuclease/phosphatase domain-containing protein n=1 Tax=Gracilariopsis chorda TaxID=448386 RepID=A0A2V3IBB9_9FLOR|nr:hypothetical protein BWQ96_10910 [Gracilariopsis chorda]|eukprot:PXF39405.1 hypothetical protein BWQ96_10910 [Gracilariopsis chorda]